MSERDTNSGGDREGRRDQLESIRTDLDGIHAHFGNLAAGSTNEYLKKAKAHMETAIARLARAQSLIS
jgi:hypothetical protein